jgi:D-arginine dehydrogenase
MRTSSDVIVVGAGVAGLSAAYELRHLDHVTVLEMEAAVAYHSTGRSAAVMSENYGPLLWRRLVTVSRQFFDHPPEGFSQQPLLHPRGALFLALEDEKQQLTEEANDLRARGARVELISPADAKEISPAIKAEEFALALFEPDCMDVDTNELIQGYLRALRRAKHDVVVDARVMGVKKANGLWVVTTSKGTIEAPILINAAGGWVREIAQMAGMPDRKVMPFRRTAVTFDPPAGSDVSTWPMTFDTAETFYFKPEAGAVMVSPVDMALSEPCDAQADELEVAIAIDRIQRYTDLDVRKIKHKWGGLRTFASDHEPVIGPDPGDPSFVWYAGQGGNGVMGGPAAGRLTALLALGDSIPDDIAALGVDLDNVSPGRPAVDQEVVVGALDI